MLRSWFKRGFTISQYIHLCLSGPNVIIHILQDIPCQQNVNICFLMRTISLFLFTSKFNLIQYWFSLFYVTSTFLKETAHRRINTCINTVYHLDMMWNSVYRDLAECLCGLLLSYAVIIQDALLAVRYILFYEFEELCLHSRSTEPTSSF